MKKILAILFLVSFAVVAGLPPTSSKGNGETTYGTTFQTNYDTIPLTRTGTNIKIGTIPITKGGTGAITQDLAATSILPIATTNDFLKWNGVSWIPAPLVVPTNAGSGVNYFLTTTPDVPTGYHVMSRTPDTAGEVNETVIVNNNTVNFENYTSDNGGIGGVLIDAGEWIFNLSTYVSSASGVSKINIRVLKRTVGGVETALFNTETDEINDLTVTKYTVKIVQPSFVVNPTDYLIIKFDGTTTSSSNKTIHLVHSGTINYSFIGTPLVTRHNDLVGIQGGLTNQYYHLSSAEYTGTGTGVFARKDGPTFTIPTLGVATGTSLNLNGTAGAGFLDLASQSVNPTAPGAGVIRLHSTTANGFTRVEQDNESATNLILGRDNAFIAKNESGVTINKGEAVYSSGTVSGVPQITKARANAAGTLPALGIAMDSIPHLSFGQVMTHGILGFNTTAFSDGNPVWLSTATAGALTATRPSGTTNYVQRMGSILISGISGSMLVEVAPSILNQETGTNAATWTGRAIVGDSISVTNVVTGSLSVGLSAKTTTYAIATADSVILCDATSAGFTVTLPTAVGVTGKIYHIKKTDSTVNLVTIGTTSSQTIDSQTSKTIFFQYEVITVISDGTNWEIL
jgi:hypothetical protein